VARRQFPCPADHRRTRGRLGRDSRAPRLQNPGAAFTLGGATQPDGEIVLTKSPPTLTYCGLIRCRFQRTAETDVLELYVSTDRSHHDAIVAGTAEPSVVMLMMDADDTKALITALEQGRHLPRPKPVRPN
jgi:hypothetical protein